MANQPELIPGLEEFWSPDESLRSLEEEIKRKPPRFAISRKLPNQYGVVYKGPFETEHDGVCVAVRRNSCALRRAKMPVFLASVTHTHWNNGIAERAFYHELPKQVREEVGHLTDISHEITVGCIHHFVPSTDALWGITRGGLHAGQKESRAIMLKRTAAYIAMESDVVPSEWIERLNEFSRVLTPCDANCEWLRAAGLQVPAHTVVHPFGLKDPMRKVPKSAYKDGPVRFLHVGKWEPRKNQHVLLGAFLHCFEPQSSVHLTMKCNAFWGAKGYPTCFDESLAFWLSTESVKKIGWTADNVPPKITSLWSQKLDRKDLADLYASHHVYLQSGRAEGFDLCALDAKCAGLRVVGVGWGGPSQFMTSDDIRIGYTEKLAPPKQYSIAPAGTMWPAPSVDEYKTALYLAFLRRFEPVPLFDEKPYLLDSVGQRLRSIVNEMAKEVGYEVDTYEA